jgi:UDPglucose 6-dehydrogenase
MRIAVVGAGYVGLVAAVCFAEHGHQVVCADVDHARISALGRGEVPIYEPGLTALLKANLAAGRVSFTNALEGAVPGADVVILAVGTPSRRGDGHADLSYVHAAARELAPLLRRGAVVVTKSTVPVGCGDAVAQLIAETNPEADAIVVSNPEFLREGSAVEDFMRPDRIVIGLDDERAKPVMEALYRRWEAPMMFTDRRTAELVKYASNAFLAMKVAFINEIADLCEATGADVAQVADGMGLDARIGSQFLRAGPGFGGSCFPKDTQALARIGQDFGSPMQLVETTVKVNVQRRRAMVRKVVEACGGDVAGKTIGVLGLSFKPETDDMRESPSIEIVGGVLELGARVVAHDPQAMAAARGLFPDATFVDDAYSVAGGADAVVLLTDWPSFQTLDLSRLRALMRTPTFVDLRNVFAPDEMARQGFSYVSIGRPHRTPAVLEPEAAE